MGPKRSKIATRTRVRSADTATLPLFESARRKAQPTPTENARAPGPSHVSTGLVTLDKATGGGFPVGAATLVAARPQVGATSLLIGAALAALEENLSVAYFSERLPEEKLRGRFVVLESRVNGHRFRAGFVSAEDRIALAAARERIPWSSLSITSQQKLPPSRIEANIFSYRPRLVLADVRPRQDRSRVENQATLLAGIDRLAEIARAQRVALVLRMILPKGGHAPDVLELPGVGAAVEPFGTAILLHRERMVDDDGDEATGTSRADARVVRLKGKKIEPRILPLRFDQRFAGLLDP